MKDLILAILEPVLSIFVVLYTLIGFVAGGVMGGMLSFISNLGEAGLFGAQSGPGFHFGWGLAGAALFFLAAVVGTGAIFTLLKIRELLEEQTRILKTLQGAPRP